MKVQARYPKGGKLTDEWINKLWYIHTVHYYLTIKRNEVLLVIQHRGTSKTYVARPKRPHVT